MRKLIFLALAAAGTYAAWSYFDRRAMARERARFAPATDEVLARRVREALSRIVPDPDAIDVTVHERTVTLRGPVTRASRDRALRAALSLPGVKAVVNRFEIDEPPPPADEMPDLRLS
jgi:osmotically-inducible protein OsmY